MRLSHLIKPEEIISPEALTDMEIGKPVFDLQKLSKKDLVFCEADRHADAEAGRTGLHAAGEGEGLRRRYDDDQLDEGRRREGLRRVLRRLRQ